MAKSFDPARAAAPPETDIVRAVFEGLTDTDPKTLEAIPAVAKKWSASEDNKVWTFELRRDAKWSNGDQVTAEDFVRSWKRLSELGEAVPHKELLSNIVGLKIEKEEIPAKDVGEKNEKNTLLKPVDSPKIPLLDNSPNANTAQVPKKQEVKPATENKEKPKESLIAKEEPKKKKAKKKEIGAKAIGKYKLEVSLVKPDKEFPALVAHPIFRPVHEKTEFEKDKLQADVITNGAFRISSVGQNDITLDRAENYWSKETVELERVRFIPQENAEKALEAYKNGQVDAVTNANFEPLALKLLEPYEDFRRTVHSALNFYEFNREKYPFNDRRVREALAIAIERERLTDDDMDGASKPALGFLPFAEQRKAKLSQDEEKAKKLLSEAGFPEGKDFPPVKLVINRNNIQKKIADSVAKMWEENLNIKTEIIVKESDELEIVKKEGDYDVIRRGVVLPTSDETANMLAIFPVEDEEDGKEKNPTKNRPETDLEEEDSDNEIPADEKVAQKIRNLNALTEKLRKIEDTSETNETILTEEKAILELPAIPLYFPTSYSLVKPYVEGFDINTLDAPSLKDVKINNFWQPKKTGKES